MKKCSFFVFVFLLLVGSIFAQKRDNYWIKQSSVVAMGLIAGFAEGQNEIILHDPWTYARIHPDANSQWWNPKLSAKNKYNSNIPLATSVMVFTTDKWHLNKFVRNLCWSGQLGISMTLYEKPNWKQVVGQIALSWGSYAMGKGIAHQIYKP